MNDGDCERYYNILLYICIGFVAAIDEGQATNHDTWLCNFGEKMNRKGVLMQLMNSGLDPFK